MECFAEIRGHQGIFHRFSRTAEFFAGFRGSRNFLRIFADRGIFAGHGIFRMFSQIVECFADFHEPQNFSRIFADRAIFREFTQIVDFFCGPQNF